MIPVIAIVAIFSIPIVAILTDYQLKMKKLKVQGGEGLSSKDKELVKSLLAENEALKSRVENLEMITSDPDAIKIANGGKSKDANEQKLLQSQIDFLAEELAKIKADKKSLNS